MSELHTATPWTYRAGSGVISSHKEIVPTEVVARYVDSGNAAFIIMAVNSHDALVKAVAGYPEHRQGEPTVDYASRVGAWAFNNETAIRAALALATAVRCPHCGMPDIEHLDSRYCKAESALAESEAQ